MMTRACRGRTRLFVLSLLLTLCGLTLAAPASAAGGSGQLAVAPATVPPVDLAVNQITMNVGAVCVGDMVIFRAQITNLGSDPSRWFSYQWFVDGRPTFPLIHRSLKGGQLATVWFQWQQFSAGSHNVRLVLDPRHRIAEPDEVNNWFAVAFRVYDTSNPVCGAP